METTGYEQRNLGQMCAAPPSVHLGPPLISETIRARKLKFYKHLGRVKYSFWGMNIFPLGGVQGVQHPTVPNVQYGVLCPYTPPSEKFIPEKSI